jgi:hypothetical protein
MFVSAGRESENIGTMEETIVLFSWRADADHQP